VANSSRVRISSLVAAFFGQDLPGFGIHLWRLVPNGFILEQNVQVETNHAWDERFRGFQGLRFAEIGVKEDRFCQKCVPLLSQGAREWYL